MARLARERERERAMRHLHVCSLECEALQESWSEGQASPGSKALQEAEEGSKCKSRR